EALARLGPGLVAQRHLAAALALAVVLAGVLAAAALPLAVVHAVAVVRLHRGAVGLAGALVGRALLALVLAGVDAAADVRVLEQRGQRVGALVLVVLVRLRLALCRGAAAAAGDGARGQPAQGGQCQPEHGASVEGPVVHGSPGDERAVLSGGM